MRTSVPGIIVRVFPEYGEEWPFWFPSDFPTSGEELVSDDLRKRAEDWSKAWAESLSPAFEWLSETVRLEYLVEGYRIAARLQQELGYEFTVIAEHDSIDPWAGLTD